MVEKTLNIFYQIKIFYQFTKNFQLEQEYIWNGIFKIGHEVYDIKKEKLKAIKNTDDGCDNYYNNTKKDTNFITTLMAPCNGLSEEEIKDEINMFIAAVSGIKSYFFK